MTESADRLTEIEQQEAEVVFERFGLDESWRLGVAMRDAALERKHPVVIRIRLGAQVVFQAALPGASADNESWIDRKMATALRYGHSSLWVGELFRSRGSSFEESSRLDPGQYAAAGGVFPILVRGTGMVGAVGVSGLPQLEDHAFALEHLRALLAG